LNFNYGGMLMNQRFTKFICYMLIVLISLAIYPKEEVVALLKWRHRYWIQNIDM